MSAAERAANIIARDPDWGVDALAKNGETLDLVKAAKCVVALSGWGTPAGAPPDCKAFMSSYFAVEVLRKAIEQHENPVLRLAPEGIEPGRV